MPNTELNALIFKRGQLKAQITRFNNYVTNRDDDVDYIELEIRLSNINKVLPLFEDYQSQIELLTESEADEEERENFENSFYKVTAQAKQILLKNGNGHRQQNIQGEVKLPNINLPDFHGYHNQWMPFFDTFSSLIQNNNQLSNIQKFHYLRSCLKGDAAQLLQGLEMTNNNYIIAWNMLRERYENKKIIKNTHVKAIYDLYPVKNESHSALRKLLDNFNKNLRALNLLGEPTESWDTLLVFTLSSKLDPTTKREWEQFSDDIESPKITELINFLSKRCHLLETLENNNKGRKSEQFSSFRDQKSFVTITGKSKCAFCAENHPNYSCKKFKDMSVQNRYEEVKKLKLCSNCLRANHLKQQCKSGTCKHCGKRHNSLLHFDNSNNSNSHSNNATDSNPHSNNLNEQQVVVSNELILNSHFTQRKNAHTQVLLPTAEIKIYDSAGDHVHCRAILDSGSQSNFITAALAKKLNLITKQVDIPLAGINNFCSSLTHKTETKISSLNDKYQVKDTFFVVNKIAENMPQISFDGTKLDIPSDIILADANFSEMGPIDVLLGTNIFFDALCVGQIKIGKNGPILHKTKFGWVITGNIFLPVSSTSISCGLTISNEALHNQLERFFKTEECTQNNHYSQAEVECETHFIKTYKRNAQGRFEVELPLKDDVKKLGESKHNAMNRFKSLEKRLKSNSDFKEKYQSFMREYESLGHMSRVVNNFDSNNDSKIIYYLPHHGVIKDSSTTTKLRVVFDASAQTSSGVALNDILKVGPTIQRDLFSIAVSFRKHNIVFTADIEKMYRQVNVSEINRDLQHILWRAEPNEEIQDYELNTVTYGTASAAFLAIRSLYQTAVDNEAEYPEASKIIKQDFYVDDLLSGADSVSKAIILKTQITNILNQYCFPLRKWRSNNEAIRDNSEATTSSNLNISDDKNIKTLGLFWNPNKDSLGYTVNLIMPDSVTKRSILSVISKIFDPLGLISPIIIRAKLILQKLWQAQVEWDESVPADLHTAWIQFIDQLPHLNNIEIPRQVTTNHIIEIQLHGFSDASEMAYGACIYIRCTDANGKRHCKLLASKSRIAPLKVLSLPRLELCGAVLLARLAGKCIGSIGIDIKNKFFWSDSTIVLSWISKEPNTWKTFVSNRVKEIQDLTQVDHWNHISSEQNPADIISRGASPYSLQVSKLWWSGPDFLIKDSQLWPRSIKTNNSNIPEKRRESKMSFLLFQDQSVFEHYSTFSKLHRIASYVIRFISNCKLKRSERSVDKLTNEELHRGLISLLKACQYSAFREEIENLTKSKEIAKFSKILSLDPFLDNHGLLRVGGRIRHANVAHDKRHPILLPSKHKLTQLIVEAEHMRLLHAGAQATLSSIRQKYWPINGRNVVRHILRKCVKCFKVKPTLLSVKMGDLPTVRISPQRPFTNVGIDFAGPILLKDGKLRGKKLIKAYICIFVCLSVKSVHLELVSDLTTEGFLNMLKRFVSRRGLCRNVYTDNGTNFVGASNELKKTFQSFKNSMKTDKFHEYFTIHQITWHMIPPRSPHFGGIWEAAVKSAKYHLVRVIGNAHLTYEDLYTVLCQVESVLNSRPITALSSDPNDLMALTPGHFLIGDALTALPQRDVTNIITNRLKSYQRLQQIIQHFWRRWSREYLTSLQPRGKWKTSSSNAIKVDDLVIIKEDNLPPLQWKLGRVASVHPGEDGVVRVVSVKTKDGVIKRSVVKVAILPIENS